MMAKDPAQRYQTFAEVIQALAPFAGVPPAPAPAAEPRSSQAETVDLRKPEGVTVGVPQVTASLRAEPSRWRWWLAGAGGAAVGLLVLVFLVVNWSGQPGPPDASGGQHVKARPAAPGEPANNQEGVKPEKQPLPQPPSPVRDLPPGKVRRFLGHTSGVGHVAALDGGRKILSVGVGEVMVWDVNKPQLELNKYQPLCRGTAAVSPDETQILLARLSQEQLFLWSLAIGEKEKPFGIARALHSLAISPDGGRALSAGFDGLARLWDLIEKKEIRRYEGRVALFSHDGKHILTLRTGTGTAQLLWYGTDDGEVIRHFDEVRGGLTCVALSPRSDVALTGDGGGCLRFWEVASGKESRKIDAAHRSEILAVAFSPDGRRALSGSRDKAVKLWEVATGRELRKWYGHSGPVTCVAFTPDGHYALSGSEDQTVQLWALPE